MHWKPNEKGIKLVIQKQKYKFIKKLSRHIYTLREHQIDEEF